MTTFDILLKNAHVEDPANGVSGICDIGIAEGRIAAVEIDLPVAKASEVFDLTGLAAFPGLIDMHVHVSGQFGTRVGFPMLVRAGVCTALNMAGPTSQVVGSLKDACGLNIATLEDASPGRTLSGTNPSPGEMVRVIETALDEGAIGVKILGGHFPLTPEAAAKLVGLARERGGYVAWHAGTTSKGSNIEGMRESIELADGHVMHLAHVNSYCRGLVKGELAEVQEALDLLESHPNIFCESYLAAMNGTSLTIGPDGQALSKATGAILKFLGFEDSRHGMGEAIRAGAVYVLVEREAEVIRIGGEEGFSIWKAADSNILGSMDINPPISRLALFLARRASRDFTVDGLATDGGAIPRNVILSSGLAVVAAGAMSLSDFVRKTSYNPSRLLCLESKGHLGVGADADITVVDQLRREAVDTIIGGQVCLRHREISGKGGCLLTTGRGAAAARNIGVPYKILECAAPLPLGDRRKWDRT
jgi:N-acyl-D-aspartate/D-glutamate deacylase